MFQRELLDRRIRQTRKARNETQKPLGELPGVTATQISDLEQGKTMTTIEKFAMTCECYNISADYLLGFTDNPRR